MTTTIKLQLPTARVSCATWICEQSPEKCADALELCESACRALNSQISSGEVQRYAVQVQSLEQELAQQRHNINVAVAAERERVEARDQELQDQLVKSLHEKHEAHVKMATKTLEDMQAGMKRELDILRERLKASDDEKQTLLAEVQSTTDSKVKCELERMREVQHAEFESRRQIDINTIQSLSAENEQLNFKIASHKAEVADRIEILCQQNRCNIQAKDQRIEDIEKMQDARSTQLTRELDEAKADLKEWQQRALDAGKEKELALADFNKRVIELSLEQRDFLATLSGSDAKGNMGESIAHLIFAELELGVLEDTGKSPSPGVADGFWKLDFDGDVPGIRALVEIKNCKQLHSQKDIAKFNKNVLDAASQNRINCALLISQRCRIENTKNVDVRIENGILVVRASRAASDELSVASLIKLAFVTVAQTWPHLSVHTSSSKDAIVNDISAFLSTLLTQISSLDQRIKFLRDTATRMHREAVHLGETQNTVLQSIEALQTKHGQLKRCGMAQNLDLDPDIANSVIDAIETFSADKGRYPKQLSNLRLDDAVMAAVTPNIFEKIVASVKSKRKPGSKGGQKRKQMDSDA